MKKILTLLLTILLCLSLIGCDNKSNEETIKEETTTQEVVIDNTKQEETTVEEQKEETTEEETTIIEEQKESTNTTINAKSYVLHVGIAEGVTLIIKRISSKVGAELGRIYPETSKLYEGDVIDVQVKSSDNNAVFNLNGATYNGNNKYTITNQDITVTTAASSGGSSNSDSSSPTPTPSTGNYLTFTCTANEEGEECAHFEYNFASADSLYYSIYNNGSWSDWILGNKTTDPGEEWWGEEVYVDDDDMKAGQKIRFKGINCITSEDYHFAMEGKWTASGDVTSLTNDVGGDIALTDGCYFYMFEGCESLTTAPNLPSTALADYCYAGMFNDCKSLTIAPALPTTNLADCEGCYAEMFFDCTSLTIAPALPATTLAPNCYQGMFEGCESLTIAPALPTTNLVNCDECYSSMFSGCISLTAAPALPATTLADNCYDSMFYECESLTTAPALPATTLTQNCYKYMFYSCTALTTAPALPATTLAAGCYGGMFYECTALTTAPALPATTLASSCYYRMFKGCSSLCVSDTSDTGHDKAWAIPSSSGFANTDTCNQEEMFTYCAGTRGSNNMSGATGESHTYYTQNTPVE